MSLSFASNVNVTVPGSETVLNASTFSIVGWIKISSSTGIKELHVEAGSNFDISSVVRVRGSDQADPGSLSYIYRAGNFNEMVSTTPVADGSWHKFLIVRRAADDYEMFVDGISEATLTSSTGSNSGESPGITIGTNNPGDNPWTGDAARLAVFVGTTLTWAQANTFLTTGVWPIRPNYWVEGEYIPPVDWSGNAVGLGTTGTPTVTAHPPDIAPGFDLPVDSPAGTDGTNVYKADDPNGQLHVSGPSDHHTSDDDGQTFSAANAIPGASNAQAQYGGIAAVAGDPDDTIHVLLPQGDPGGTSVTHEYRRSTDGGANWSSPITLVEGDGTTPAQLRRVQIEVDGNGDPHIVGLEKEIGVDGTTWYFRSIDGGATMEDGVIISIMECQALAVDESDGNVYIAGHDTQDQGVVKVVRSTDNGATFGAKTTVSGTTNGARVRATADGGTAVIAWQNQDDPSPPGEDIEVAVSTDAGANYASPVTAMDASARSPLINKYQHFDLWQVGDVLHMVACPEPSETSPAPVHYAYSTDGGSTWEAAEMIGQAATVVWMVRADADFVHVMTGQDLYSRRAAPVATTPALDSPRLADLAFCRGRLPFGPGRLPVPDGTID